MRGTPAAIAASSTRSVVPTFASSIAGRSDTGIPTRYEPAAWIRPSAPRASSVRVATSDRSLATSSTVGAGDVRGRRRIADEGDDVVATRGELADDRPTDEARCARDDDAHRVSRPACRVPRLRARP